ncbi:MAG: biopolymer transporter ExbD [Myxococcales bacterium]|nr:biopolymer transporter ExbD [Myxococcales bacterium]
MSFTPAQARSMVRKAVKRVPEGEEIRHLNIMPMMDMMTILLVAFIAQISQSTDVVASAVSLPESAAIEKMPESATALIITTTAIIGDGEPLVAVKNGDIDASDRDGGTQGVGIPKLTKFLAAYRQAEEGKLRATGKPVNKTPELFIIADKSIPFGLLYSVLASAREKEAGYKRFRFIVEEFSPVRP